MSAPKCASLVSLLLVFVVSTPQRLTAQDRTPGGSTALTNNPPVALCNDIVLTADGDCTATGSINAGSYDPDADPVTIVQTPAGPYALGVTTVTLRITDNGGLFDQCQATVTVEDNTPPQVFCPEEVTRLECGDPTDPTFTGFATLADNCDPSPALTYEDTDVPHDPGGTLVQTIFREWIGTDASGNVGDCIQAILIYDETPPYFTFCPPDITIECDESTDPSHTGEAEGSDNCAVLPDLWYVDDVTPGSCPHEEVITRIWHLNDNSGSDDVTCVQYITVVDNTPPQIECPAPIAVATQGEIPAPDPGLVTASDNCDPQPTIEFFEDVRLSDCPLTFGRVYRATDACGNTADCQQVITVDETDDITPPVIVSCPEAVQVSCYGDIPAPDPGLVIATDNCDQDLTIEHIGDDSDGQTCPTTIVRTYRATDDFSNSTECSQVITAHDLIPPVCEAPNDQILILCEPQTICIDIEASDNCTETPIISITDGPGDIVYEQWCYEATTNIETDVTIQVMDACQNTCEVTFHVSVTLNEPPVMPACPDAPIVLHWDDIYTFDFSGGGQGDGEDLTYSLSDDAPVGSAVNLETGEFRWVTGPHDICRSEFGVIVTDPCGIADTCLLDVCVYNEPPSITCPDDVRLCHGFPFEAQLEMDDADGGPYAFFYLVSGPFGLTVDAVTGLVTWDDPAPGTWEVTVTATDSAAYCDPCSPASADTCSFVLEVTTLDIVIEKIHDQFQGQHANVSVDFMYTGTNRPISAIDLLIQYDPSALSFQTAYPGQFLEECGWEYFTYRYGSNGNCGPDGCPSGVLRVMAIAETTGGDLGNSPDCYTNDGVADPGPGSSTATQITDLVFLVSDNRTLECQYVPIKFIWYDCGDNSMANPVGDTLYISNRVYDYYGESGDPPVVEWDEVTGFDGTFPTNTGAIQPDCSVSDKSVVSVCANFYNGGIDIVCADSIDAVGDINLNGIAYEIADGIMLTNYFLIGLAAFGDHPEGSIAASDTNRDGLPLSVADLVYLIRVVIGDALPYAKITHQDDNAVSWTIEDGVLSATGVGGLSGAALTVRGEASPKLLAQGFELRHNFDGSTTRIVVTPAVENSVMPIFDGPILSGLRLEIERIEFASREGQALQSNHQPSTFHLAQNYPNPFNPATTILYTLSQRSHVELTIYNIVGQEIVTLVSSDLPAGDHSAVWRGRDSHGSPVSSGVYLYRLKAGDFVSTRKMLLLK
jgi:hypothetical protein